MAPAGAKDGKDGGIAQVVNDLWVLVRDYAKQETVDPIKSLGKFVAYGVGGSLALAVGLSFLSLALLRALQTETGDHLTGSLSWIPYAITFLFTAGVVGIAVRAVSKPNRDRPTSPTRTTAP